MAFLSRLALRSLQNLNNCLSVRPALSCIEVTSTIDISLSEAAGVEEGLPHSHALDLAT